METCNLDERKCLLLTHRFFDFGLAAWQKLWLDPDGNDPFTNEILVPRREAPKPQPRSWQEAMREFAEPTARAITFKDPDFPDPLRDDPRAPPILYVKGAAIPASEKVIAIVGTRKPTLAGQACARSLAALAAERGLGVVSGLALGIDAVAHETALRSEGYTLAVLGSGIDRVYPKEHEWLAARILDCGGTIVSQFPENTIPHPSHFPRRNFVLAALSAGVAVVEGAPQSGAGITGRAALERGLTTVVFTQDYRSDFGQGAISLLRLGAYPANDAADALAAMALPFGGSLGKQKNFNQISKKTPAEVELAQALSIR